MRTPREAADVLSEMVFEWTRASGRPLVLSGEDREAMAAVIEECLPQSHYDKGHGSYGLTPSGELVCRDCEEGAK